MKTLGVENWRRWILFGRTFSENVEGSGLAGAVETSPELEVDVALLGVVYVVLAAAQDKEVNVISDVGLWTVKRDPSSELKSTHPPNPAFMIDDAKRKFATKFVVDDRKAQLHAGTPIKIALPSDD